MTGKFTYTQAPESLDVAAESQPVIKSSQAMAINDMAETINASCHAAGWYTDLQTGKKIQRNFGEVIALMHSELSEAYEGHRKGLMDDHLSWRKSAEVELADTIIRILDTAHEQGFDIGGAIQEKFAFNQIRDDHKLENRKKPGGKKT